MGSIRRGETVYNYAPLEIVDLMSSEGRLRLSELRNLDADNAIEIIKETEIISNRMMSPEGIVYDAKVEIVLEYVVVSESLVEPDVSTDI